MRRPLGPNDLNFMYFLENLAKWYVGTPGGSAPPSAENSGSAPGLQPKRIRWVYLKLHTSVITTGRNLDRNPISFAIFSEKVCFCEKFKEFAHFFQKEKVAGSPQDYCRLGTKHSFLTRRPFSQRPTARLPTGVKRGEQVWTGRGGGWGRGGSYVT